MALTAVPSSGLFLKRQTRCAQTSDVLKNKSLDGTAAKAENFFLTLNQLYFVVFNEIVPVWYYLNFE